MFCYRYYHYGRNKVKVIRNNGYSPMKNYHTNNPADLLVAQRDYIHIDLIIHFERITIGLFPISLYPLE